MEVGCLGGRIRLVTCDVHTLYLSVHIRKWTQSGSSSRDGCNQGTAAEADVIGEQQLK